MCKAFVTFRKAYQIKGRKTKRWTVDKIDSNIDIIENLGIIKFSGAWRQYIFEASPDTFWSYSCLEQIVDFLKQQNKKWRQGLKRL